MNELEPALPIEFVVQGTPVSLAASSLSKDQWKARIREASKPLLPDGCWLIERGVEVTLYYFPDTEMQGDIDNIAKVVLDACKTHIYVDDHQVERLVIQKFEPERVFEFRSPTEMLAKAIGGARPLLYVRISDSLYEDLR